MQNNIKYNGGFIQIGELIFDKNLIGSLCSNLTLIQLSNKLSISEYQCKKVLEYFGLEPKHNLCGTKRIISKIGDTITYWDDDCKKSTVTKDEFLAFYHKENHTDDETDERFKISTSILRKAFGIHHKPRSLTLVHNRETCIKLYGDPNYNNQKQSKQTCQERYGVDNIFKDYPRIKKSYVDKLGVEHPMKSKEILNKMQSTNLRKYGNSCSLLGDIAWEKGRKTCLRKYGMEYPMQSKQVRDKFDFKEMSEKIFQTRLHNGTLNTSKPEEDLYKELIKVFAKDDVKRQYKDTRYPYRCDFYIKSIDLFIELNLFFTHGGKQFDSNNSSDLLKLGLWKEKAKTSKFYENAIKVWTQQDVEKQRCAKDHGLNYLMVYTIEEYERLMYNLKKKESN